jgi:hypothetical protein
MTNVATGLTVVGALACWYFVAAYHLTTGGDWRRNPLGRHLMAYTANMGALFLLIVAARLWPTYPGRTEVTVVFYTLLVAQIIWRCVLLHRAQRRG